MLPVHSCSVLHNSLVFLVSTVDEYWILPNFLFCLHWDDHKFFLFGFLEFKISFASFYSFIIFFSLFTLSFMLLCLWKSSLMTLVAIVSAFISVAFLDFVFVLWRVLNFLRQTSYLRMTLIFVVKLFQGKAENILYSREQ